jgi:hypothetical protein
MGRGRGGREGGTGGRGREQTWKVLEYHLREKQVKLYP